jgi:hypothetical protein
MRPLRARGQHIRKKNPGDVDFPRQIRGPWRSKGAFGNSVIVCRALTARSRTIACKTVRESLKHPIARPRDAQELEKSAWYAGTMDLSELPDQELLRSITRLTGSHRELTVALVVHLGEIEERKLHLVAGFSSLFEFCTKALRFSEGEAFRRILTARLGRRFPVVHTLLASGEVNLSTLELLRVWLTEANHAELLAAVAGKSKREVQALLAARFPRPDRPSRIRRATVEPLSEASFRVEFTASAALRENSSSAATS